MDQMTKLIWQAVDINLGPMQSSSGHMHTVLPALHSTTKRKLQASIEPMALYCTTKQGEFLSASCAG